MVTVMAETTRVLYCCRCGHPLILEQVQHPVPCECGSRYFDHEPPKREPVPLVWTENDVRFLRSLRISV